MASLNQCNFIGNLGKDPEVRTMGNGNKVANISLAVSESWKDKGTGEKKEKTTWVPIVIFGNLADIAEKYLRKGSKVFICGKFQTRKWQDKDGNDRYSTEIVLQGYDSKLIMLDGKNNSRGASTDMDGGGFEEKGRTIDTGKGFTDDMDSEIPF